MLALSGDEILLGEAAELGPIDPQMQFVTEQRPISVPARAAIDQFARAAAEIDADPGKIRVWLPIIRQYGPAFLQECQNAIALSEALVTDWLSSYMFKKGLSPRLKCSVPVLTQSHPMAPIVSAPKRDHVPWACGIKGARTD